MRKQAYFENASYAEDDFELYDDFETSYSEDGFGEFSEASYAEDDMEDDEEDDEHITLEFDLDEGGLGLDIFDEDSEELDLNDTFLTSTFGEEDFEEDMTLAEALEDLNSDEGGLKDLSDELEDLGEEVEELSEEFGDLKVSDLIPGTEISSDALDGEEDEKETDYINDGDLSKFMQYISSQYPHNIPSHDGTTTVGCERAISFLDRLNSQISKAIREDTNNVLDLGALEDVRASIMRDVITLKEHLSNLKKKLKDSGKKTASQDVPLWNSPSGEKVDLFAIKKQATTPNNMVISVTPFERAIVGIMINAHVSAGHPMGEVYEALKEKYDLTEREELAILQLCLDSGYPIFKDRGSSSAEDDDGALRLDFVKNYFA
jgi:hypothetical protein